MANIDADAHDSHNVTLSLRHHLVTCNACTRLWGALEPDRKTFRASWWLCPEGTAPYLIGLNKKPTFSRNTGMSVF
jgi:hypothetical protein